MKYIIGLGNPGEKYRYTRHNIAWLIFESFGLNDWKYDKYMHADFIQSEISNEVVLYIKPNTFMNNSGQIMSFLKKEKDFSAHNIILIHDDLDLPFGKIKISYNRGDGGNNGVRSIIQYLKSKKIIRIRVGISNIIDDNFMIKPNVLSHFSDKEKNIIKKDLSQKIKKILKSLVEYGLEKTMNIYNTK